MAVAGVAVGRDRDPESRALDAEHRRVTAGRHDGRVADHVVVAAEDASTAAEVGARQESQQSCTRVGQWRQSVDIQAEWRVGCDADQAPDRRSVGEQRDR